MPTDETIREAKVFLASRIAEEGERQGVPLSETERKMLYYSDSGWTLPDMPMVREAFAREYDRTFYERKVSFLIRSLRARLQAAKTGEFEVWNRALEALKELQEQDEEHYIFTLIAKAQPKGEIARLIITALVVGGVILVAIYLVSRGY